MSTKVVLDTSAIVKWFIKEEERKEMLVIRDLLIRKKSRFMFQL